MSNVDSWSQADVDQRVPGGNNPETRRINDIATFELRKLIHGDHDSREAQDAYRPSVVVGKRNLAGTADLAAVQAELDRVFGPGELDAEIIMAPPGG